MIIIIGAGISGLSTAWHLQQAGVDYTLLESSSIPGGYIQTIQKDNCILELGPNSILCDEEIVDFIKAAGLENDMQEASEVSKSRYILKNGKYRQLPDKPQLLLFSNFFSLATKWKIFSEPFAKKEAIENETLDSFFTRRFSKEISDYALNPFVSGIFAGNPKELLVEETFPILKEYEKNYGSVLKGFIKNKPTRRKSYNFKNGMATLPKGIAANLKNIKYGYSVTDIQKSESKVIVVGENQDKAPFRFEGNAVVITSPAFVTSKIIKNLYPAISDVLNQIEYPPMIAVHTVYSKKNIGHDLDGFGALNPSIENQFTSGCIWTSSVFPEKTPDDKFLFTSFVGGVLNAEKTKLSDETIKAKVHQELSQYFNIKGNPDFQVLAKWEKAIPQYNQRVKELKAIASDTEKDHIYFCTNWLNGVSLSDCIKKGKKLAEKIAKLQSR